MRRGGVVGTALTWGTVAAMGLAALAAVPARPHPGPQDLTAADGRAWLVDGPARELVLASTAGDQVTARVPMMPGPGAPVAIGASAPRAHVAQVRGEPGGADVTVDLGAGRRAVRHVTDGGRWSSPVVLSQTEAVVRSGGRAYLVGRDGGVVGLDPSSLVPIAGSGVVLPGSLAAVGRADGRLVVLERDTGVVDVVEGASVHPVGRVEADAALVAVGRWAAVIDRAGRRVLFVGDGQARWVALPVGSGAGVEVAPGAVHRLVLVVHEAAGDHVVVVDPADGTARAGPTIAGGLRGLVGASDDAVFALVAVGATVLDLSTGSVRSTVPFPALTAGRWQAFVHEGLLWIDDPDGRVAEVVQPDGRAHLVDKGSPGSWAQGAPPGSSDVAAPVPPDELAEASVSAVPGTVDGTTSGSTPGATSETSPGTGPVGSTSRVAGGPAPALGAESAAGPLLRGHTAPSGVEATAQADGSATVTWRPPTGAAVVGYLVVATSPTRPGWTTFEAPAGARSLRTPADALGYDDDAEGDTSFVVVARWIDATGAVRTAASRASDTVDLYRAPAFARGSTLEVAAGPEAPTLSWAPAAAHGRPVTYTVTCSPGCGTEHLSEPRATLRGLRAGVAYAITVVAANDAGPAPVPLTATVVLDDG